MLGSMAGYALARFVFRKWKNKDIAVWILSNRMFPPVAILIPYFLIMRSLRLLDQPLAIIIATSGVVRDMLNPEFNLDASPGNITKQLDIIDDAAFRARKITRQLLDLGRKNAPRLTLCNINHIIDQVTSGIKECEFRVEDIELIRNYDPDLPAILLDEDQIRQVFLNLINNAGDAISGQGTISISTKKSEKDILVTIADTGAGMSPEQMKQIFNPFYTTKETGKGTGLGLSVSLSIIEAIGGTIDVQSLKGSGSEFTISLPIKYPKGDGLE